MIPGHARCFMSNIQCTLRAFSQIYANLVKLHYSYQIKHYTDKNHIFSINICCITF